MLPDEIIASFLTKKQMQKLKILRQLKQGPVLLTEIEDDFHLSKRQAREVIDSVVEDIYEYSQSKSDLPDLQNKSGKINFSPLICDEQFIYLLNNMREKYVTSSSLYQVLLFVLEKRSFRLSTMADTLAYSQSYSYKLLGRLKKFLISIEADVKLTKKKTTTFELSGNESSIRMLHYFSTILISRGEKWLFKSIEKKEILSSFRYLKTKKIEMLSPINQNKIYDILAIYELANRNHCKLDFMEKDIVNLGEVIGSAKEIHYLISELQTSFSYNERVHLSFFMTYLIQEFLTKQEKEQIGIKILDLVDNKIVTQTYHLLKLIQRKVFLSETIFYQLAYSISCSIVVVYHFGLHRYMVSKNQQNENHSILNFLRSCIEESLDTLSEENGFQILVIHLLQVISGYITVIPDITQYVYLEFFQRPEYKFIVEKALEVMYTKDVIQISEDYYSADIVISDTCHSKMKKKYFYFNEFTNQTLWKELGAYLGSKVNEKNYQENS